MQQLRLCSRDQWKLLTWVRLNLPAVKPKDKYNPQTLAELEADRAAGNVFVFAHGAPIKNTIFYNPAQPNSRAVMHAYRAWHDTLHLKYGLKLGGDDELELAKLQQVEAEHVLGMSEFGAYLLRLDLELHIKHYEKYKQHPNHQRAMIEAAIVHGQEQALNRNWS